MKFSIDLDNPKLYCNNSLVVQFDYYSNMNKFSHITLIVSLIDIFVIYTTTRTKTKLIVSRSDPVR